MGIPLQTIPFLTDPITIPIVDTIYTFLFVLISAVVPVQLQKDNSST